jgi:hypothetical protein
MWKNPSSAARGPSLGRIAVGDAISPLAMTTFRSHNAGMSRARTDVKFEPVEWKILPEWYVLATFPEGKELRVSGAFKTQGDAQAWIASGSAKWLKEHRERKGG